MTPSDRYGRIEAKSAVYIPSSYRATSMSLNTYGVQLERTDERFAERVQPWSVGNRTRPKDNKVCS